MCGALMMWNVRNALGLIRWAMVLVIIALQVVMKDPVYFLMARIDLTGSSTGWFRSQLIRSSLEHLGEWWATGTDYTRHWMPSGIAGNANHTDMTNHFLQIGVWGGLPLLVIFVMMLRAGFRRVGAALKEADGRVPDRAFLIWALGAMLFGEVINFWSISLYDQSVIILLLGAHNDRRGSVDGHGGKADGRERRQADEARSQGQRDSPACRRQRRSSQ